MEYLELVIMDLEERIGKALALLQEKLGSADPVILEKPTFDVTTGAKEDYQIKKGA